MPTALKHIEETLDIVKTLFVANLATYLTAINVEKGDGITLTAPRSTNYAINEIDAFPEFPYVQFVPDTSDTVVAGGTWDETDHHIIIKAHNASKRGQISECAKRTYRYARAIAEIIIDNRTISSQVIGIQIDNINYDVMMSDGNGFKQEVWVHCTVKHHGTFS